MIKRDKIFYAACGVFLVGVILAVMEYEFALLFIVGAYLLRPSLHVFDLAGKQVDERQVQIYSRSGNIAFIAVMITAVGLALLRVANGETADEFYTLIGIGIAARAVVGLLMIGELRRTGVVIVVAVGVVITLFALASAGFSTPGLLIGFLGLLFASLGFVARRFPRAIAAVLTVIALAIVFSFKLYQFRPVGSAMTFAVLVILLAAVSLFLSSRPEDSEAGAELSKSVRAIVLAAIGLFLIVLFTSIEIGSESEDNKQTVDQVSKEYTEIEGIAAVGPFDYYRDGKLQSCTLARLDTLSGQPLPAGTVVHLTRDGALDWCFLQQDTEIQGHLCRGESHGFMTGFHPNGQLKTAWLARDEVIQGIPCAKFRFMSSLFGGGDATRFYDNGQLSFCTLSEDATIEGQKFEKGDPVRFDENGTLIVKE
ncbi:MAG: hypothetical protein DRP45_04100 [Candidatus Zixiibacteriota bacterium]|nr:MAG: hypothetical protein DRP45_04100 [candidate division Zixibacteria bacterium]